MQVWGILLSNHLHFKDNKIKSGRGLQHWKRKWKKSTLSLFTVFTTTCVLVAGTQQGRKTMVFLQAARRYKIAFDVLGKGEKAQGTVGYNL